MKVLSVRILDALIPPDIKEFEQSEELTRARSLVFAVLFNLVVMALIFVTIPLGGILPHGLRTLSAFTSGFSTVSYAFTLWIFWRSGLFSVCGNIFASTTYISTLATVFWAPDPGYMYLLLVLIAVPVVMSLISSHTSAIAWLVIVSLTPEFVALNPKIPVNDNFIYGWVVCCLGIFYALYMENYYREAMRQRLNAERTQFEFAAAHDPLTGVANRTTFDRRLKECIEYCRLHGTKSVLIYIDLDKFKPINDTYGHQAGDVVLTTIANRLRRLVRSSDTVARLGGDEFAILFEHCDPRSIEPVADRVAAVIREPIEVFDIHLTIECSIGRVVCPDDGTHPAQLAHKADERMYAQKRGDTDHSFSTSPKYSGG